MRYLAGEALHPSVLIIKSAPMKNEPVVTYNHMEEDETTHSQDVYSSEEKNSVPISIYMIFVVDVILISALIFIAARSIF
jgi:hypothetical protein